jgi:hypothetical protein
VEGGLSLPPPRHAVIRSPHAAARRILPTGLPTSTAGDRCQWISALSFGGTPRVTCSVTPVSFSSICSHPHRAQINGRRSDTRRSSLLCSSPNSCSRAVAAGRSSHLLRSAAKCLTPGWSTGQDARSTRDSSVNPLNWRSSIDGTRCASYAGMASSLVVSNATLQTQSTVCGMDRERTWNSVVHGFVRPVRSSDRAGSHRGAFDEGVVAVCFLVLVGLAVLGGALTLFSWVTAALPTEPTVMCREFDRCVAPEADDIQPTWVDDSATDGLKFTP